MNRSLVSVVCCMVIGALAFTAFSPASSGQSNATPKPKTILLGFDGVDAGLVAKWMSEGQLPNLKRLSEQGTFSPLMTANPAQSPVSWAVLETASNPGKTNIGDFVRRKIIKGKDSPQPTLEGVTPELVPPEKIGEYVKGLSRIERFAFSLGVPSTGRMWTAIFAIGSFLVALLLFRVIFRIGKLLAVFIGLLFGAAAAASMMVATSSIPPLVPVPVNERQGKPFWDVLGEGGVRFTGLQVPAAFPAYGHSNVKLLGGLFVPDVQGGPGSWAIYTNDEWELPDALGKPTDTGGRVFKVFEEQDGSGIRTKLNGPVNFAIEQPLNLKLEAIEKQLAEQGRNEKDDARLKEELKAAQTAKALWNKTGRRVQVDFVIKPDYANKTAALTIDGQTQTVKMGEWSDWFRITFKLNSLLKLKAIGRVHVAKCEIDKNENRRLEVFVPPISISPEWQPPNLPISWPRDFAAQIAEDCGLYDTIGWACWTNPLKDGKITEQAFMDSLEFTMKWRTKQLERELKNKDWDVLFHLESITDRAGHLLYRFIDPQHPQYDTAAADGSKLRDQMVKAYGRTFALKDGILETYREMDRVVGEVATRIDKGEFGADARLLVVSDHGFQPFRYGVNLNNWLLANGYLTLLEKDKTGVPVTVDDLINGGEFFGYVDWTKTKAFAMGLGKIYINKKGRETAGIVTDAEMPGLVDDICTKLEATLDPARSGGRVVKRAYAGRNIYSGAYLEEPGDIILGFASGYRASWQMTLGALEKSGLDTGGIVANNEPWTGDHCGVDPELVKGIFFSNRKIKLDVEPTLLNIAPTICSFYGVATPPEWDGKPLDLSK